LYRAVDSHILSILRQRYEDCRIYEAPDGMRKCKPLYDIYEEAEENYSIKCLQRIYIYITCNMFLESKIN